jgi:hypothetical protein
MMPCSPTIVERPSEEGVTGAGEAGQQHQVEERRDHPAPQP